MGTDRIIGFLWRGALVSLCLTTLAINGGAAGAAPPRSAVPADGNIVLTDFGMRDWGPELVHYTFDPKVFAVGKLVLLGPDGEAIPFQVDGDQLAFVATVPRGESVTYALRAADSDRSHDNTGLAFTTAQPDVVLANEFLSLRLPSLGTTDFDPPVAADGVAPPIRQWRVRGGEWMGDTRFLSDRRFASQSFTLVRAGPACVEYEARYTFVPRGEYVMRVRLSPGVPLAAVTEEFDLGETTEGHDLLVLNLHTGWTPETVAWVGGAGEAQMPKAPAQPLDVYLQEKRSAAGQQPPVGGTGEAPAPVSPSEEALLLEKIVPGGKWGGYKGGVQVAVGATRVGLVTLHVGSWRRTMALNAWYSDSVGVSIGLPFSVRHMRWSLDIADDFSPFSTHEHDEGLPRTYGRREWGLYFGDGLASAQAEFGHIGLDRYKEWVLDWPDTAGAAAFPGGLVSAEHVSKIREQIDQHPDAEFLRTCYVASGDTADAVRHANKVIDFLKKPSNENDFFLVGLSHYRKSQFMTPMHVAEDALACPDLPADLRMELRRRLALYAYAMSDPDLNPRGSGVHLGNNNMTINRTLALTYYAALLPDHPRYEYWMRGAYEYARFKLASQTAPCGAWVGCPTYQLYSPTRTLNITQNALRNRGFGDLAEGDYHAATLRYLAHLTVADARFDGQRIIAGMGNSANRIENIWGISMATVADHSAAEAGWLRYFDRMANTTPGVVRDVRDESKSRFAHDFYYLPFVPENARPLTTTVIPAYGVVFRNRFGEADETAMLFRTGIQWSHWDTDSLNVVLYAKGAPLSPGTGYQYISHPITKDSGIYHNRVKVGVRDAQVVFGRVDAALADYGFGPTVDYAMADHYYPPEVFKGAFGEMHWRRHVVFVKRSTPGGTDYFVMRDTFEGDDAPTWWTWLNLGGAERISVDGKPFDAAAAPTDKVVPEAQMPVKQGQVLSMDSGSGVATWMWFSKPMSTRVRMTATYGTGDGSGKETKTAVEIPGSTDDDYLYVVYPLRAGEQPPTCEAVADGVVRVRTEGQSDTIFAADRPSSFRNPEGSFAGKSGVIRVLPDRVVLSMTAGGGRIGYGGHILEGHGPFEQTIALEDLIPGTHPVAGGYEKKRHDVEIGRGITVSGEGPFKARLDGERIVIHSQGRARVLHVTQPSFIIRPQYYVDGQEWMACWTDYPASGWGTYKNTWLIALSVPEGDHELIVKDMVFPSGWTRPFDPLIDAQAR